MEPTKTPSEEREDAIQEWENNHKDDKHLSRSFSGERRKSIIKNDWLGKVFFIAITGLILFFIIFYDPKKNNEEKRKEKEFAQITEPSSRDFRPPVMPANAVVAPPETKQTAKPEPEKETKEDAEKRQQQELLESARFKSGIMVKGADTTKTSNTDSPTEPSTGDVQPQPIAETDSNRAFSRQFSNNDVVRAKPQNLGNLECVALQGKSIDAVLETAIHSDLPGQLRAIVSTPLYAEQGIKILIPSGSRVNGNFNTSIRKGQNRIFAIWNRIQRPDGIGITIDSPMTDTLGRSGVYGDVDNHYLQIFGMSTLLSIIGVSASNVGVNNDTQYNSASAYRQEVQQSFSKTSQNILEPYSNIPPTLHLQQGTKIKIFLNRDLDFCTELDDPVKVQANLVLP